MKKLSVMSIVLAAVCCFYGCESAATASQVSSAPQMPAAPRAAPVETEYATAQKNVTFTNTIRTESGINLSTVKNGYAYADTVVIGTVNTVSLAQYKEGGRIPTSEVDFSCEKILKGEAADSITFSLAGGYMTMAQYAEHDVFAKKENAESRPTNGYAQVKIDKRPVLAEGEQYVVFLAENHDGSFYAIGSDYFALSVKDGVMTDFGGREYTEEEITQPIPPATLAEWSAMYIYRYSGEALAWEYTIDDSERISQILALINAPTAAAGEQSNPDGGMPIEISHAKGEDAVYCFRTYHSEKGACSDVRKDGFWYSGEPDDYNRLEKLAKGQ